MRAQVEARLAQAQQQSVATYLRRQRVQLEAIRLQQLAAEIDQALVRLDSEIAVCEALLAVKDEPDA